MKKLLGASLFYGTLSTFMLLSHFKEITELSNITIPITWSFMILAVLSMIFLPKVMFESTPSKLPTYRSTRRMIAVAYVLVLFTTGWFITGGALLTLHIFALLATAAWKTKTDNEKLRGY